MTKIFVSTVPFGEVDSTPIKLLEKEGLDYTINPLDRKLVPEEVAELAKEYDGIIAGTENLDLLIDASENLKIISRVGIGLDSVPLKRCKEKSITVTYTPDAVTMAVAELAIGIFVSLTRHVNFADREIRKGNWKRKQGKRIQESVIGIIGLGRIGTETVKLLAPFKPEKIIVNDIKDKSLEIDDLRKKTGLNIVEGDKGTIYKSCEIVSLHVPLSPLTYNLINKDALSKFREDSFLVNLARGGIVNESDLYDVLSSGSIAGAAIDCFVEEPYKGPLADLDNILMTQHMGSCSFDCRAGMEIEATKDLIRFFKKEELVNEVPDEEYLYQLKS